MSAELVIKNCKVATPDRIFHGGVAVAKGKTVKIASDTNLPIAKSVVDGKGNHRLPGAIDSHVHFREPGYEYKEEFGTASHLHD